MKAGDALRIFNLPPGLVVELNSRIEI